MQNKFELDYDNELTLEDINIVKYDDLLLTNIKL